MSVKSDWVVEHFYFGSAVSPSERVWRRSGDVYQEQVWGQYTNIEDALRWVEKCTKDLPGQVFDPLVRESGEREGVWIAILWFQDLDLKYAKDCYDREKKNCMGVTVLSL